MLVDAAEYNIWSWDEFPQIHLRHLRGAATEGSGDRSNPESDYYLRDDVIPEALENQDYYTQENVFWVPADARWESLRNQAKQPDIGQLIDRHGCRRTGPHAREVG